MRSLFLILFLCLPVWAGQELIVQKLYEDLQKIADKYYSLTNVKISSNGRWLIIRKSYDLNNDTVLIFNSLHPEKPVACRIKIGDIFFPDKDYMLLQGPDQAELLNLKEKTSIHFKGVKEIQELKSKKQFILHYTKEEKSRLELRNISGELLNVVGNVNRFYTLKSGHIYAITETGKEFKILLLKDETAEKVYGTFQKISYLEADSGEQGIMIYEQNTESNSEELLYLDLATKTSFPLKEVQPISIQNGFRETIRAGSVYFLRLWVHKNGEDTSLVDIWYGNDHQLEEKFYPPIRCLYYVWEPKEKRIRQIGNNQLAKCANIGNERYFLSVDPYLLQDYIQTAPLQINIYDRLEDHYTLMDTVPPELHVSPDGQYVLYSKSKTWYIYQIATGIKKTIGDNGLQTPYFTHDGRTVLFGGEGGLWLYNPKEGELTTLYDFKGFQTTILNADGQIINNFNFYRNTIALEKPLVIKLYDRIENKSSFTLCYKRTCKTIIPLTTKRIEYLNYNNTFSCFSWVEEDYNQPPRLVYKETGKKETVIFQSNKEDKAILSLNQEIISYTNSDGTPLKGILYYPLHYTRSKKYPMVVHIYQVQSKQISNEYPIISYSKANNDGFNLRLLLEKGYFVYFPDIVYGEKGTGLAALDCVNHALDAIENNRSIDKNKIGLIGHSHGGYETNFIATHSDRFAAYVSGAGNSDIVRSYFSFNYNFLSPFYWQYENGQYEMKKSFCEDKDLYFHNNPIHYVDQVNAPILLWTGMKDRNIHWEQTMEFYIGLKRNNKKVVALFYPHEAHTMYAPDACKDLVARILMWFDYFLKGNENAEWINKEIRRQF